MHEIIKNELMICNISDVAESRLEKGTYDRNLSVKNGRHSDCFVYVISGSCKYTFKDGMSFTAEPGDIIYLARGDKYTMRVFENSYIPVFVDFLFETSENNFNSTMFRLRNSQKLCSLFKKLYELWLFKPVAYKSFCFDILYEIYGRIVRQVNEDYIPTAQLFKLDKAKKIISDEYSNTDLSVQAIADTLGMSAGHFRRLFKRAYGCSPIEYLKNVRISYAKKMLLCSDCSISEISEKAGFSDVSYFSKVFRQSEFCAPKKYRTYYKTKL